MGKTLPLRITKAERPSFGSSVFPWGTGPEDGVEDAEEAAHAGDDGDLFGAAAGDELLVVGLEHRVPADGGEGRHVEDIADGGPAACDGPVAAHLAAVAV